MENPYLERKQLTFEQAEGVEALPSQLRSKEVTAKLRSLLWRIMYDQLQSSKVFDQYRGDHTINRNGWGIILYDKHVEKDHLMADDFPHNAEKQIQQIKQIFSQGSYIEIFGFLQYVLRHRVCPRHFGRVIEAALRETQAGYRLLDSKTFVPIASEDDAETLTRALADLSLTELNGARQHMHNSADELRNGAYAASIRESIHAVESVARSLTSTNALSEALSDLAKKIYVHPALKAGFLKIYGFTSDEKGIRHPLLDQDSAKVDEADALFMLSACAAFISYLLGKAQSVGLLSSNSGART